jgi:hypothetical protein
MLCSLQAENHRLAQELLLLRQQQQHGIARREAPARSSPSPPPASASGNSSSSKSDAGASTARGGEGGFEASNGRRHQPSKAGEGKSKSESSANRLHADEQRLSVSGSSTDPHAALDAEILRALLHWGQALHKIRPKIGPGDTLYSTVEWLIQEHANLMRLVSAAVAPRCTSLAQVVTQFSTSPQQAAADSEASSNSSQQTSPLLIVPHSDYKMSEAHAEYRVFSSLVRVPGDRKEHRQHPRVAHSSRCSEPGGAARRKGRLGSDGSSGQGQGAEHDVSGDSLAGESRFLAGAADSHISEVSRCVRDRPTCRVCE